MIPRPHLTIDQLAERFGVSRSWVNKHLDNPANIPTPVRIGGRWKFRQADIEAWEARPKLGTRTLDRIRVV